jgi:2-phosphosulfolactate phosphatase
MSESARPEIFVHLLPSLIPPAALLGGIAVVVDVLRATTVMVQALSAGCAAILPCGEVDEARAAASGMPAGSALLAGERQGLPIDGFDLGNSPGDFTPERCRGKTVVMTTTNGTRAILASLDADRVLVAAFSNLAATARELAAAGKAVHIICAGTDGLVSYEDTLLAGALVEHLSRMAHEFTPANDSALLAGHAWSDVEARGLRLGGMRALEGILSRGRGGRRVREIGLGADIAAAAEVDSRLVTELRRDPLRIVRAG